jgi:hypothetical protein
MTLEANIFTNALTIEELEAKLKATTTTLISALLEGSCVETQPSPKPIG